MPRIGSATEGSGTARTGDRFGILSSGVSIAAAPYKCAHLMIFGRPQVGLDAAVSAGGRGRTPALSARQRRRKFWAIFLYSRHFQLTPFVK